MVDRMAIAESLIGIEAIAILILAALLALSLFRVI